MAIPEENRFDAEMGVRVARLLKEAEEWCRAERGRQARLAKYLGVKSQLISGWFAEYKKEEPKRNPNAEQILALDAFMRYQQGQK